MTENPEVLKEKTDRFHYIKNVKFLYRKNRINKVKTDTKKVRNMQ